MEELGLEKTVQEVYDFLELGEYYHVSPFWHDTRNALPQYRENPWKSKLCLKYKAFFTIYSVNIKYNIGRRKKLIIPVIHLFTYKTIQNICIFKDFGGTTAFFKCDPVIERLQ